MFGANTADSSMRYHHYYATHSVWLSLINVRYGNQTAMTVASLLLPITISISPSAIYAFRGLLEWEVASA